VETGRSPEEGGDLGIAKLGALVIPARDAGDDLVHSSVDEHAPGL
jgi:hypothetical protein